MAGSQLPPPPPPVPKPRDGTWWLLVGGLAACALGLLLPWAQVGFASIDGLSTDDGKIFAVLLGVTGALVYRYLSGQSGRGALTAVAVLGLVLFALAVYEIVDIESISTGIFDARAGSGLYLDLGGAATTAGAAAVRLRRP